MHNIQFFFINRYPVLIIFRRQKKHYPERTFTFPKAFPLPAATQLY